jgi:acetyltransferase-like isoleucine patch superfamily enzyme
MKNRRGFVSFKIARLIANLMLLPVILFYKLETWLLKTEEPFVGTSQLISLIPGLFGNLVRSCFYEKTLRPFGQNSCIGFGTIITHSTAQIGENVSIGSNCTIGTVTISNNVLIGSNVDILSGRRQHDFSDLNKPIKDQRLSLQMIFVGEGSWIGNSAVIMANIGKHCIVGAGSVLVEDLPDYSVAVGNPARVIKRLKVEDKRII